jgi:hypothetical protein
MGGARPSAVGSFAVPELEILRVQKRRGVAGGWHSPLRGNASQWSLSVGGLRS